MLIDGGATINLMMYSVFKKLEREDDELVKTNLMLNGMGQPDGSLGCRLHGAHHREQVARYRILCRQGAKAIIMLFLVVIGFTPIIAFLLLCISS
jgi:hypothetical protein